MLAFSEMKRTLKLILVVTLTITVFLLVSSYVLAMFLGPALFFFTPEGSAFSMLHYMQGLPLELFIVFFFVVPVELSTGLVFLFLWGIFILCFVAAWKFREKLHKVVGRCFSRRAGGLFNNWLFTMPVITSMLLVAVIAITSFQEAHGVPTGEAPLPEDPFEAFFLVTYASLFEEIGFRVSTIGAFLLVYLFWVGRNSVSMWWRQRLKLFFLSLIYPDGAKKMVGAKTVSDFGVIGGISLGEWGMVIFTSVAFGLAHYLFGSGSWEVGKITTASMVGFAMGLAYLLYGVQAPILIHWFFNYYTTTCELASNFYTIVTPVFSLIWGVTIILGAFAWLTVIVLGLVRIAKSFI